MRPLLPLLWIMIFLNPGNPLNATPPQASAYGEVALTFDDLPCAEQNIPDERQKFVSDQILRELAAVKAPAAGFVNEVKVFYRRGHGIRLQILKDWIHFGHVLGNHTYSHFSLHNSTVDQFIQDIKDGWVLVPLLMGPQKPKHVYFRYPYLATGNTKDKKEAVREFLRNNNYINAPITIDSEDWKYNDKFKNAPSTEIQNFIKRQYLDGYEKNIIWSENMAKGRFGRPIKHIVLMHANQITGASIHDVIQLFKKRGYQFISLEEALEDPFYHQNDKYVSTKTPTWLHRFGGDKSEPQK